jgi:hypothetical protein
VPYVFAFIEASLFTALGVVVTLTTLLVASFRHFLGFAWRLWLWGSIGFVIGNLLLLAILSPFLVGVGIAGGAPRHTGVWDYVLLGLVLFGPLLVSTLGIGLGCWFGWSLARRRSVHAGV